VTHKTARPVIRDQVKSGPAAPTAWRTAAPERLLEQNGDRAAGVDRTLPELVGEIGDRRVPGVGAPVVECRDDVSMHRYTASRLLHDPSRLLNGKIRRPAPKSLPLLAQVRNNMPLHPLRITIIHHNYLAYQSLQTFFLSLVHRRNHIVH
jgi:hypothetical protein